MPNIEGISQFKGQSFHTYHWPKEKIDFTGKNVAMLGTGATAIQAIVRKYAKDAGQLSVYQRNLNWCAPLNNGKISKRRDARYTSTLS